MLLVKFRCLVKSLKETGIAPRWYWGIHDFELHCLSKISLELLFALKSTEAGSLAWK